MAQIVDKLGWLSVVGFGLEAYLPCPRKIFMLVGLAGLVYICHLVALNNVYSFLHFRYIFVYVAPDGHCVNSQSS